MARTAEQIRKAIFEAELKYTKRPSKRNAAIMREQVIPLLEELKRQETKDAREPAGGSVPQGHIDLSYNRFRGTL